MAQPPTEPTMSDFIDPETGAMRSDHPLLAPIQEKLRVQLVAQQQRLEEEMRMKKNALKVR